MTHKLKPFTWYPDQPNKNGEVTIWRTFCLAGWGGYAIRKMRNGRFVLHRGSDTYGDRAVDSFAEAEQNARQDLLDRIRQHIADDENQLSSLL